MAGSAGYELVSVARQNGGRCSSCDQWVDLSGTQFVSGHSPAGTTDVVAVAAGRIDAAAYAGIVATLGSLVAGGLLGVDHGCSSCPADGASLTIVVARDGNLVETRFDALEAPEAELEPLREWAIQLMREVDDCSPDRVAATVTCLTEATVAPRTLMETLNDAGYVCEPGSSSEELALLPDPMDWLGSTSCAIGPVQLHHWTSQHAKLLNMVTTAGTVCPFITRPQQAGAESTVFVHGTTWFAMAPPTGMNLATAEDLVGAVGGEILPLDCDGLAARLIERFPPPYPPYDNRNVNILSSDELRHLLAA